MAKQLLSLGTNANDNTGDTLRAGGDKVNDNFNEMYTALGNGTDLTISLSSAGSGQVLRYNGTNFVASDYLNLTSALDVNGNSIISSSNGNFNIAPNGTGNLTIGNASITNTFNGTDGTIDFPTKVKYKNEFPTLAGSPAAATYTGYFFTVDGDDNPYVNINITAGGAGDVQAKLLTQYSSVDLLKDIDITTAAPTEGQVLKWSVSGAKFVPGDDAAGASQQNLWATFGGDTGTTSANTTTDTLTIAGGTNIATAVSGDTLTVNFDGTLVTTLASLTDTSVAGVVQGNSLFWNGTNWAVVDSPVMWWELGSNGSTDYTFDGPGFASATNDPTLYVSRGFTYAFDNTTMGGAHPFRIQSTQGLTGTPYTAGQSGSGTSVLYWTVPMDAPSTLYYQCTLHASMQGQINVVS